jgi:uncharacterized integral membrane protein
MRFMFSLLRFWLLLLFVAMSGYIALYNQESVPVSLPPWLQHISVPAYQAYSAFLLIGAALTVIFFGVEHTRKSFTINRLNKRIKELEASESPVFSTSRHSSPSVSDPVPQKDSELNPV